MDELAEEKLLSTLSSSLLSSIAPYEYSLSFNNDTCTHCETIRADDNLVDDEIYPPLNASVDMMVNEA